MGKQGTASVRVMVVDDTDHVRTMLTTMLELDGFKVVAEAAGGDEALRKFAAADPDVVVMDYKMPGMDGLAATRRIREVSSAIPVILYTAYLDDFLLEAAAQAGVSLCVGKVDGVETLERQIHALCLELADVDIR